MKKFLAAMTLALVSLGAHAGVDLSAFDTANQKMDCLIAADTLAQRQLCVAGSKTSTVEVVSKISKAVVEQEAHHWKVVGANPAKAAYRAAKGRTQIAHKVTTDLNAMKVVAADVANIAPAIIDEILDSRNLLSGDDLKNHQAQWSGMLKSKTRYVDFIKRGDQLDYLSFRNGVKANVVADFDGNLLVMVFPLADGRELLWIAECQNFAIRHHDTPPVQVTPPIPEQPVVDVPPELPPSVSPDTEEAVALVKTTVGVWGGIHTASGWDGHFSGAKVTVTLPLHTYLGLDEDSDQLWIGAGIRGDQWRGRSKTSAYKGSGQRVVPLMFVLDWNGRGGLIGDTHSGSFNAGVGTNFMKGKNSASGYYKNQLGKEVHVRLENCERSGDWIFCAYAEGNGAFGRVKLDGSWSGDTPNKTSNLMIGGSVEYLISDHWSAKAVLEGSIQDNNPRAKLAITGALEVCYRDRWEGGDDFIAACVGPYVRLGEYDGFTFGGTGNIFAGRIWSEYVKAEKSNAVSFPVQPQASPFIQASSDGGQEEVKQQGGAVNMGLN